MCWSWCHKSLHPCINVILCWPFLLLFSVFRIVLETMGLQGKKKDKQMAGPGLRHSLADRLKKNNQRRGHNSNQRKPLQATTCLTKSKGVRGEPPLRESAACYTRSCPEKERKKMKIPLLVGHSEKCIMRLKQESSHTLIALTPTDKEMNLITN